MGKMLKRIDNHLARSHRGVTRGMNDRQPYPVSHRIKNSWVRCQFPKCNKEVLHLSRHVKNIHSITIQEYHLKFGTNTKLYNGLKSKGKKDQMENCDILNANAEEGSGTDGVCDNDSSMVVTKIGAEDSEDKSLREDDRVGVFDDNSMDGTIILAKDSEDETLKEDSSVDKNAGNRGIVSDSEDESADENASDAVVVHDGAKEDNIHFKSTSNDSHDVPDYYNGDRLRYLVHNSSPDGLRFLLTFMKKQHSLEAYYGSNLCKVFFKNVSLKTIQEIYCYRHHLMNYYRYLRCYPFPETITLRTCLACGANQEKPCICPILPEEFYVYCRHSCPQNLMCTRCVSFEKGVSHKCIDFFHCKRCNEEYTASTKFQPYPQSSAQVSFTHF